MFLYIESKLIKVFFFKYKKSYNIDFNVVLFNFITLTLTVYYLLHIKSINNI